MPNRAVPSLEPTGEAALRLGKYLWSTLPRDSTVMRKQVGGRWLTHRVARSEPVVGPLHYEHIIPVLVFALRHEIHREEFSHDDVFGCIVTEHEHRTLQKLRSAPNILIPALACEREQLLDVCLRRYSDSGVHLVALPKRIPARQQVSAATRTAAGDREGTRLDAR